MKTMYDFAFSEQGYNHVKVGKVCQDFSGNYSDDVMSIIVVADGHGSDNYPRTDKGSRFAVEAALSAIRNFVDAVENDFIDISVDSENYLEQLAKNILSSWYDAVEADLKKTPFLEDELVNVSDKYKARYMRGEMRERAYGTTLIAACQTKSYWFGLQIGDGKCVCIARDGSMYEPIPWDDDCEANITTSICDSEAIEEFRYCFMQECPAATLIGTDGIDDSYVNSEELYVLYRSILAIFAEHGCQVGESEIRSFLPGLSRKGSGDDVSIAGIISATLSKAFIDLLKAQCEYSNAKSENELAEREVVLATEKQEYVFSALNKAKMNYELCRQKTIEAEEAVENARIAYANAAKRLGVAENALEEALRNYQGDGNGITVDDKRADEFKMQAEAIEGDDASVEESDGEREENS